MTRLASLAPALALIFLAAGAVAQDEIDTVAGGGPNDVPALSANLEPFDVAIDGNGNLYIAAALPGRIFKVDATGQLSVIAGTGNQDVTGDGGLAVEAALALPLGVAADGAGNVFIAESNNQRIRRVDATTGIIDTVAGGGMSSPGDGGPATDARLIKPEGVAVDGDANIYIADEADHRVRRVDATSGNITTVAGTGTSGYSGDGGAAVNAELSKPVHVALDSAGNLFIAEQGNHVIRRVDALTGDISTVAGDGSPGSSGDGGLATDAQLNGPRGVALDTAGNLFIPNDNRGESMR